MIALVRRNLGCSISKHSSSVCISHVSVSHFLRSFSTSPEGKAVTTAAVYDVLVKKHHFSPEIASAVSSDLSRFRSPEKADSILTFLKDSCFSSIQLQKFARSHPRFLTAGLEDDLKLKIKIFRDFGFSPEDIAKMSTTTNNVITSSAEKKLIPQLSTLKGLLGSNHEVVALVKRTVWYMTVDLEKTFIPNVDLLKSCGVTMQDLRILLYNFPRCLLVKPEVMRKAVEKVKEIGVDQNTKTFLYAVRVIASLREEIWELKMQGFREMGVSECEVLAIFRKMPMVLCTSLEKMKAIRRLLVATGRYEMRDLLSDPVTFMCSVERRYKPRLRVLEMLESRGLIKKWPPLSSISKWTNEKFFQVFVRPYKDQLGEVCVGAKIASRANDVFCFS
ncbi:uncharacterized protein LOC131009846 [Salvia miltiorrhiza]|uniref:uncharacterized protein LOC131009846 n=1 Tax=Salvia miltiorrhiza TaxID=226208 RepID=UPI0025AB805D|nr:uncharacterized protein LOC131009846 [Salvia miltiorrhiza]